ncbi:HAMP domain-containing histidine kinase [Clostridium gasigenes]|uniref:sensor histidine kinase n=1 Tax=Clostridium gasigenes TaxID=94869 RepID=UPI001C0C8939|nr:HAMP domain-containing sensor histidine kinase [Clostridium gasigenes]MBU3136274.1 HAMP domain-containing histidine kinase [Clostridium gasigenes]
MIINVVDFINTVIQSVFLSYIPFYFIEKGEKESYKKVIIVSIILFFTIVIGTAFGGNTTIGSLIIYIINIIIIGVSYKKDYKKAIIANGLGYFCIQINVLICVSIYLGHIKGIVPIEYLDLSIIIFLYCPQFIMQYLIFKYIDKMNIIYKDIVIRKYSLSTVLIIIFSIQYMVSYIWIMNEKFKENSLSRDIIMIAAIAFLFVVVTYFSNLQKRINEISKINKELDLKITELKKVKHDYGAQISYLYGVHLMGNYERLGELLKDIIKGNNSISNAVELTNSSDSVISIAMRQAVSKGINVVIDEKVDLDEIIMSELELQRVILNIVGNSITAMDGRGLITAKTYKCINSVVIKIQNNGPRIEENTIDKIFNLGFSTKKHGDHGFGLAIVKEIVEKYKGTIKVISTDDFTEFKIILPIKRKEPLTS